MKQLIALLTVLLLFNAPGIAQSSSIKGSIADTSSKRNVANAVVALLTPKDSVLYKFTRTDAEGNYAFKNIKPGNYVLMVTHPQFAEYVEDITAKDGENTASIAITNKSKLLQEVIVQSGSSIKMKGDTVSFIADSFKVKEGASVEALLKKLPGIQVDKNGKITAMGEEVKKVLVDGEEFFGDDPGIAIKNLRADAVKEVQVFDKKSDQAAFTGIDDGEKNKTINLKLKEDRKKGFFGKTELAGGLKDNYNNSAMLNAFKGKRKIATYGIMSNTGQTNLDWNDAQNYGGGIDGMEMGMSDDGGMYMSFSGNGDDNYRGGRNGIPKNWNGGLHYSNKFDAKKQSINMGYRFTKVNALAGRQTYSSTYLPDSSWSTNRFTTSFSSKIKHAFNSSYEINPDSANSFKLTVKFNNTNSRGSSDYYTEALGTNSKFINNITQKTSSHSDNNNVNPTLLWKHKFKKNYRTISINTDFNWFQTKSDGLQYALSNFYKGGALDRKDTIDQQNLRNTEGQTFTTRIAYTEPLMKDIYLELNYSFTASNNGNDRTSLSKDNAGNYSKRIDSLSNNFQFNRIINKPGFNFRYNKKKFNYSIGSSFVVNSFTQKNLTKGLQNSYSFTNFAPTASASYKLKGTKSVRIYYNGYGSPPSADQLQPIKDNSDRLNIYTGNPDLKQSFQRSINLSYNFYDVLSEKNMWTSLNYSTTHNSFAQNSKIGTDGVRTYQTVNVDGNYYLSFYMNYGLRWKKPGIRFGFGPNINSSRSIDFVNGTRNKTLNTSYGLQVYSSKQKEDKYDFSLNPRISYVTSKSAINTFAQAKYWQATLNLDGSVQLPGKTEIGTDVNFEARQKDPRYPRNNNYTLWNAYLEKKIYKSEFVAKFSVQDILNQNRGYSRDFNSYSFTENYYNTLKRYWMLTLTWNFSKNGKPVQDF